MLVPNWHARGIEDATDTQGASRLIATDPISASISPRSYLAHHALRASTRSYTTTSAAHCQQIMPPVSPKHSVKRPHRQLHLHATHRRHRLAGGECHEALASKMHPLLMCQNGSCPRYAASSRSSTSQALHHTSSRAWSRYCL